MIQKISNNIKHPSTAFVLSSAPSKRAFAHLWTYYKDTQPELYTRCDLKPMLADAKPSKLSCLLKKMTKPSSLFRRQPEKQEMPKKTFLERLFTHSQTLTLEEEDIDWDLTSSISSLSLISEDSYIDEDAFRNELLRH